MFDCPARMNTFKGLAKAHGERANINTAARNIVGFMVI
jgi:hypothetical protein